MSSDAPTFHLDDITGLRPAVVEDADQLNGVIDANRGHLRCWLPWLDRNRCVEDTRAFLASAVEQGRAGRGRIWLVEHANAICGVAGFVWIDPINRVCEIGYWLDAALQRRGIMTRCVSRLVRHAFEDLGLNRVTIRVAAGNARSRAIPRRLGFREEGVMREAEWLYDHFVDQVLYAQVRSDWRAAE